MLAWLQDKHGLIHYVFPRQKYETTLLCLAHPVLLASTRLVMDLPRRAATCLWCVTLQSKRGR